MSTGTNVAITNDTDRWDNRPRAHHERGSRVQIVTRAQWGARPWTGQPYRAKWSDRTEVLVHYHGNPPKHSRGVAVPRDVDDIHHGNGWSGVGYNWVVDLDGVAYEGRGWNLVGAHCPGHNRSGIGIYVAVGGSQLATPAAKATVADLYDAACRRAGRSLRKSWHGENYSTACPGPALIEWVKSGMPRPGGVHNTTEDDMPLTPADIGAIWNAEIGRGDTRKTIIQALVTDTDLEKALDVRLAPVEAALQRIEAALTDDGDA